MQDYKDAILKQIDIEGFYSDYGFNLNGKNHKCPFHDDTNPSLSINRQNGLFKCHGCDKGGSIFDWFMLHHNVDFKEALAQIAEKYNLKLPGASKKENREIEKLTDELVEACHQALPESIKNYLNKRGISDSLINKHKLGWWSCYGRNWIVIPIKNVDGKYALLKLRRNPLEENKNDN